MSKQSLAGQIESAQRSVKETARTMPWLYPAYQRLTRAEQALRSAQEAYDNAKAEWDAFCGNQHDSGDVEARRHE